MHENDTFQFLKSILYSNGEICEDANHKIITGWIK
jgi:hypothetical protein